MSPVQDAVAVIDIGKTNAKVVLVGPDGAEIDVRRRPNTVLPAPPYPHFASETLWDFVIGALTDMAPRIRVIVPVTHGASAALVDSDGSLVLPVLDYEHDGPDATRSTYQPPSFGQTGSPPLPGGLNVGAQLHWLEEVHPKAVAKAATLLMWPQWWAWRLSGVAASEVTSLGCHTDLWHPEKSAPSSLAQARGWDRLMPPLRRANDVLGCVSPQIAEATGLGPDTLVLTGIHDSNASLLPYLDKAPCGVLSTGTWVIAMAIAGAPIDLDPSQDMLLNVAMDGRPVPTARFMGGRERDLAVAAGQDTASIDAFLGVRAAHRLADVGAKGPTYVEGPFAASESFLAALERETRRPVIAASGTGTTRGAAALADSMSQGPAVGG